MVSRDVRSVENTIKCKIAEELVALDKSKTNQTAGNQGDPALEIDAEELSPITHDQIDAVTDQLNLRRSARVSQELDRYEILLIYAADSCLLHDPRSCKEVSDRPDHKEWLEMMDNTGLSQNIAFEFFILLYKIKNTYVVFRVRGGCLVNPNRNWRNVDGDMG